MILDSPPQQDFERDSGSKASENVVSQCKEIRTKQENNNIVNTEKSQNKISADDPEVQSFLCSDCGKSFKSSLYKHAGNSHKISIKKSGPIKCLEKGCAFTCARINVSQQHLANTHSIDFHQETKKFHTLRGNFMSSCFKKYLFIIIIMSDTLSLELH